MSRHPLRDRLDLLTPPFPWDRPRWVDRGGPPVVLLHGLWRGFRAMAPLERALGEEGFSTLNIPYPSPRFPVPELARRVAEQIRRHTEGRETSFVTHSLGGILLRQMLATEVPWKWGRCLMLAPPNEGSEIVDWLGNHPALARLLGPAGRSLGSHGLPKTLPAPPTGPEWGILMGTRPKIPFFQSLLEPSNDGIVSTARGRLAGVSRFAEVDADHTFIQMHPDTIRITREFLRNGRWNP